MRLRSHSAYRRHNSEMLDRVLKSYYHAERRTKQSQVASLDQKLVVRSEQKGLQGLNRKVFKVFKKLDDDPGCKQEGRPDLLQHICQGRLIGVDFQKERRVRTDVALRVGGVWVDAPQQHLPPYELLAPVSPAGTKRSGIASIKLRHDCKLQRLRSAVSN